MGPVPSHTPPHAGAATPPSAGRSPNRWVGVLALVLAGVLMVVAGLQTWQLLSLSGRLAEVNDQLAELRRDQAYGGERLDALEERAGELERITGEAFNPETVAAAVLPSVFMVVAGDFTGTAFAIGPAAPDGGTHLLTNFHVIAQVWERGDDQVGLERTNQRYRATIVDVSPENDLAWLHTTTSFRGLTASEEEVRAGQPIIAVGAPHGLTDTVTTGVISSPSQRLEDGSGPWIQFDAAVNPGNSGGPVVNGAQEVVGIATAKREEAEGLGFAVPIEVACRLFRIC